MEPQRAAITRPVSIYAYPVEGCDVLKFQLNVSQQLKHMYFLLLYNIILYY